MNHVAVDLGSKQSRFCIRTPTGEIEKEARVETALLKRFFSELQPSRIILETCSEAFTVANWALEAGHDVRVVPSTLAPALGVGDRGIKTDKRDARNLSLSSCRIELPGVHVPSTEAQELRAICTSRDALVSVRTKLVNTVRAWMRTEVMDTRTRGPKALPARVKEALAQRPNGVPKHLQRILAVLETLNEQILDANAELKALAAEDEICRRLMTAPGVGPVTAARFRASIDQVDRFPNAHALQSYVGLTPGENSTGERQQRRTGITRAGPAALRWTLVQAAWSAWRTSPNDPMTRWAQQLSIRRGKQIAATALARKLSGILYAMWRDGKDYEVPTEELKH